jgi:UDP-2,3-diacylglucosamine pyrophosphatase LpxH
MVLSMAMIAGCGDSSSSEPDALTLSQPLTVTLNINSSSAQEALATIDPPKEIILTFSEPLNKDSVAGKITLQVVKSGGALVATTPAVEVVIDQQNPNCLIVRTTDGSKLLSGEEYRLAVASGVTSEDGSTIAEDYIRFFATDYDFALNPNLLTLAGVRTKTIIISDIHLGDQRSIDNGYGWLINNREKLVSFLKLVRQQPDVKELVIAGDLFDEWVAPMEYDAFNGATQSGYVDMIAIANKPIIDAFNDIILDGNIRVTYVPGNHDMLVQSADLQRVFPGINEMRDAPGLGIYSPSDMAELAIEHGHRYDFYNAPDPISNLDITRSASILSPGFFVSKIASSSDLQKKVSSYYRDGMTGGNGALSNSNYLSYWAAWQLIMSQKPVKESWDAKVIKTGIDGYSEAYAINDLIPHHASDGAPLDVLLYKNIQDSWWEQRQTKNRVAVKIVAEAAIAAGAINTLLDLQSETQYFLNKASNKRIVVFGHTHEATLLNMLNHKLQWSIYANTGTWVDNSKVPCTFVAIYPQKTNGATTDTVTVYQYVNDTTINKIKSAAIRN